MTETTPQFGPRERLRLLGEARLSDTECLALILRTGTRSASAQRLAATMLERFGGLAGVAAADVEELAAIVGPVRAGGIAAACGIARRLTELRLRPGTRIADPGCVARLVRDATRGERREHFFAVFLDNRHRVIRLAPISVGSLRSAPVHPREVFGAALRAGAAAIVLGHNHPSGDANPSVDDRAVTERLIEVGELCGVEVLDHVVVGAEEYYSFAAEKRREIP